MRLLYRPLCQIARAAIIFLHTPCKICTSFFVKNAYIPLGKNCNFRFSHCRLKSKKRAPCVVKCCSFRLRTHGLRLSFYLLYILLLLHQSGVGTSLPAGLSSRIADRRRSTSTRLRTPVSRTPSGTPEERPMLRAGRRISVKPSRPASRIR